jgi:hypothetical protein
MKKRRIKNKKERRKLSKYVNSLISQRKKRKRKKKKIRM